MNNQPIVSIIIPTYNRARLISQTLDSILYQNYENWECIVVDDGSIDNTEEIVQDYVERDKRFQYHKRPDKYKPGGNGARNYGYFLSKGKYIQYVDADDLLSEDKIESQMKLAEKFGDENIYSCSIAHISDKLAGYKMLKQKIDKSYDNSHDWLIDSWSGGGFGQTLIWITPRKVHEMAGLWNENVMKNQDGEFFCRVLLNARSIFFSEEGNVFYRISHKKNSVSTTLNFLSAQSTLFTYELYEKHTAELSNKDFSRAISNQYYKFVFFYFPHFNELRQKAIKSILRLGYKPENFAQNKKIYYLIKLFGLERSLQIIHLGLRIRKLL